jgi:hypothetical protein
MDNRNALLLMLLVSSCSILFAQSRSVFYKVHFHVDEFLLDDADRTLLDSVAEACARSRYAELRITAHTDHDAGDGYNMKLSQKRANAVTSYLKGKGIDPGRVEIAWFGERKPGASNRSESGKSENRRVDIELRTFNFTTVGELLRQAAPPSLQTFTIDAANDNAITGRDGTTITIPANVLQTRSGKPVTGPVTVELHEFLKPSDAAFHQLSTICSGRILETGGMFTVKAMAAGEELELKKNKTISAELPAPQKTFNDMELFAAVENPDGIREWKALSKPFAPVEKNRKPLPYTRVNTAYLRSKLVRPDFSDYPKISFTYRLPAYPVMPLKSVKPRKPRDPSAKDMYSWVARTLLPDAYIERKVEGERIKRDRIYQEQLARYERRNQKYLAALARYQHDTAMFESTHGPAFYEWLSNQKRYNENYIKAVEQQAYNRSTLKVITLSDNNALTSKDPVGAWIKMATPSATKLNEHRYALRYISLLEDITVREAIMISKTSRDRRYKYVSLLAAPPQSDNAFAYTIYTAGNSFAGEALDQDPVLAKMFEAAKKDIMRKREKAGIVDGDNASRVYYAALSEFGTYNCDRFNNTPPSQLVTIRVNYPGDARVSFFLPSINGFIYALRDANGYYLRIPKNSDVTVVMVAFDDMQGISCALAPERVGQEDLTIMPGLKQVRLSELEKILASLSS